MREFIKTLSRKFKSCYYRTKISASLCTIFLLILGETPLNKNRASILAQDRTITSKVCWLHGVRMEGFSPLRARAHIFLFVSFVQAFVKRQSCHPWNRTHCDFSSPQLNTCACAHFHIQPTLHLGSTRVTEIKIARAR